MNYLGGKKKSVGFVSDVPLDMIGYYNGVAAKLKKKKKERFRGNDLFNVY